MTITKNCDSYLIILFQWEDKNNLNCPELVKQFEDSLKKKTKDNKSNTKTETKSKTKKTTKSKRAKVDGSDQENKTDEEEPSIDANNTIETTQNEENSIELDCTHNSSVADVTTNDEPISTTKSRLKSTCKFFFP